MNLFKTYPITSENKKYEIRVLYDETKINVVAFHNNYPANGFRYQVQIPKKNNTLEILEKDCVSHLVETSKNDIIKKRWETFRQNIGAR